MVAPSVLVYSGIHKCATFAALVRRFDVCYGIEADPEMARKAQEMFAGNPKVHIIHGALCETNGSVLFNIHDNAGASSLGRLGDDYRKNTGNEIHPVNGVMVPAINLHDFLVSRQVETIDLYQSDIQGMDFAVLRTLRPMIERRAIKVITCETERDDHDFQSYDGLPSNRQALFSALLNDSYRIVKREKIMPGWIHQDITWKLKPRYLLKWYFRRAGLA